MAKKPTTESTEKKTESQLLYEEAIKLVIKEKRASVSILQRKLRIGYARASFILDQLEENEVVGESRGAKPREVLMKKIPKPMPEVYEEPIVDDMESGEVFSVPKAKEKGKRSPNPKMRALLKKLIDNVGTGMTMKDAMKSVGYSDTYATNPQELKKSDAWNALMEKHFPDDTLAEHHEALLNARTVGKFDFPLSFEDEEIIDIVSGYGFTIVKIVVNHTVAPQFRSKKAYYLVPDSRARKDALDMAYKLKQKYGDVTITHKLGELSDSELEEGIARDLSTALGLLQGAGKKKGK